MGNFENFSPLIRNISESKFVRVLILLVLVAGLIVWGVRSCSKKGMNGKVYKIATNSTWGPIELQGKEPNMLAFLDDLITEIAQNENLYVTLTTLNQGNLFEGLKSGYYDAILEIITPNPVLEERFVMSESIFLAGPVLVVQSSSSATTLESLEGKEVGVIRNSAYTFKLNQIPSLVLVSYDNIIAALEDLEKGTLSGVVMNAQLANTFTKGFYKGKLKVATAPLTKEGIRLITLWTPQGEYLIEHFNAGLKALEKDGRYDQLITKWALFNP